MNLHRRFLSLAALTALTIFACSGCHSKTQQSTNSQAAPSSPAAQPSSGSESAESSQPAPGGQAAAPAQYSQPAPQAPPPPAVITLPAGTDIRVRLGQDLGSKISRSGDSFSATVADPVIVNGRTVIPRDAQAEGVVVDAQPLGRFKGGALLQLRLERVTTKWGSYPVQSSSITNVEKGKGKRTAILAGGGAGLGALIGGLAGGGKGALIGALAGGGAGTAGSAFTGNKQIFLPAETLLTFHLDRSVHITEGRP